MPLKYVYQGKFLKMFFSISWTNYIKVLTSKLHKFKSIITTTVLSLKTSGFKFKFQNRNQTKSVWRQQLQNGWRSRRNSRYMFSVSISSRGTQCHCHIAFIIQILCFLVRGSPSKWTGEQFELSTVFYCYCCLPLRFEIHYTIACDFKSKDFQHSIGGKFHLKGHDELIT